MSDIFDRADALFVQEQMGGKSYLDSLQADLEVAKSNLSQLEEMKAQLGSSEIVDQKIVLEKERIAEIEKKLISLGVTPDADSTNVSVIGVLDANE